MPRILRLKSNQCVAVKADRVVIESGSVWLTQSGNPNDEILFAGESYRSRGSGKIVVQTLAGDTRLALRIDSAVFRFRHRVLVLLKEIGLHSGAGLPARGGLGTHS